MHDGSRLTQYQIMSRILLILLALLGLGLASCSSSHPMEDGDHRHIDSSIETDPINPHPRGMSGTGVAFDRYWMSTNSNSPYAHEDRGFFSTVFGGKETFGEVTQRQWRPKADLYAPESSYDSMQKWVMNRDSKDPYVR